MNEAVIVSGVRTPVGRYMGVLKDIQPYDLAAIVIGEVVRRAGIQPELVDQVVMGQSYQNGEYVNIARMGLLTAGWPENIPGLTLDSRCCTGLGCHPLRSRDDYVGTGGDNCRRRSGEYE